MRPISIFTYYAFGYNFGLLRRDGFEGWGKEPAIRQLKHLLENLKEMNLRVTLNAATEIESIVRDLEGSGEGDVEASVAKKLKEEAERIDTTLDAELQLQDAYLLTEKRYSNEKLLDKPESLLSANTFRELSDTSKRDFSLGCRQIAFSQSTAAAFHLMRAVEEQVKMLYFEFKKTKRLKRPMWGPMISELRNKRAPRPTEKVLDHLDGIRVHFRNPTQHPESFYTLDEAQDLLNQTITAFNMIRREIRGRR